MRTRTRLALFGTGLAAAFAAAVGIGGAVPAVLDEPTAAAPHEEEHGGDPVEHGAEAARAGQPEVGGLQVSQDGHTLDLLEREAPAGTAVPVAFRVVGPDGEAVTTYERRHEQELHLIAVRRDTTGFQHVHPELAADGTWSTALDLTAGQWRLFADFAPAGGDPLTLGADLAVPGPYHPAPLPTPSATAEVDGYTVTLDGALEPGEESRLVLSVSRDGRPVTDLEPYLAAYGHLVVLRSGDLAYLHVHPVGEPGDGTTAPGPEVVFMATAPSAGDYRLYLDFQHEGVVRTAAFTVTAGAGPVAAPTQPAQPEPTQGDANVEPGHSDPHPR